MKLKNLVVLAAGAGAAYLLGTEKGRARLAQLTGQAKHLAADPRVQSGAATVAEKVSQQAHHLPQPAQTIVRTAADQVHQAVDRAQSTVPGEAAEPEAPAGPPPVS